MQIDERGVVRRLRIAIRHAHDHRFLQAENVAEVVGKIAEQRQFRRARIAEDRIDPESAQQIEDDGADSHRDRPGEKLNTSHPASVECRVL
jgi:hypothetical protein